MADEQNTEQVENTQETTENNDVVLTQSKLDSLIDKGYSKGVKRAKSELEEELGVDIEQAKELIKAKQEAEEASKSELEKLMEQKSMLEKTIESLESTNKNLQYDMQIQQVVQQNGINDADYFKHLLQQESAKEDFDMTSFMDNLKGGKPYLFNNGVQEQPKKVDATSNKATLDVASRIGNARSMDELYKLQQEIS